VIWDSGSFGISKNRAVENRDSRILYFQILVISGFRDFEFVEFRDFWILDFRDLGNWGFCVFGNSNNLKTKNYGFYNL